MRGGRPLNRQIANLTKSIDYLTNRIRKPEYRRQIATNTAQIEKQTKERERLRQQQRLADAEIYAKKAADNAKTASNARAAKENARVAATPSTGIFSAIQSTLGMSPSNPANTQTNLRDLIAKAEQLSKNLQSAANTARATIPHGGKHRNRRTRRR